MFKQALLLHCSSSPPVKAHWWFPGATSALPFALSVNPSLLQSQHCCAYRHLKVFLITFAISWIQQQKKITLNPKYKLPKMHYKGERITPQIMRMDKQMVKEIGDVVDDPDFPLMTKRRPITVPGPPKSSNKARQDASQAATSSSQAQAQQQGADMSARQTTRAGNAGSAQSIQPASSQGGSMFHWHFFAHVCTCRPRATEVGLCMFFPGTIAAPALTEMARFECLNCSSYADEDIMHLYPLELSDSSRQILFARYFCQAIVRLSACSDTPESLVWHSLSYTPKAVFSS